MSRDPRLYLDDMLDGARKALEYTHGVTFEQFQASPLLRDAVVLNLQIIGEAANHVPEDVQARYPQVEWRRMIGLRNVIAHGYFGLDLRTVWETIQADLPMVMRWIRRVLDEWPEP